MTFDPEGTFTNDSSIFGMPKDISSSLELLPVCWEPTTSFKKGTAHGPKAVFEASKQMDLYHPYFKKVYENGVSWNEELLKKTESLNIRTSALSSKIIKSIENGEVFDAKDLSFVNEKSNELNTLIYNTANSSNKTFGLLGGDHSTPFGLISSLSEKHKGEFSIVHVDAHFDFRDEYQGFEHSHASIMHNVKTKIQTPPDIHQLGIRDFCESEYEFAMTHSTFMLDHELHSKMLKGMTFDDCLNQLFKNLKEKIYISFDIDGLSPEFCPNTGTPVPGGITYNQAVFMIRKLHEMGHKLIGFDLVEVSPGVDEPGEGLDEVIASRILYELSCFALSTN